MADLTQPEPQKIDPTRLGSKIFDPDPSLTGGNLVGGRFLLLGDFVDGQFGRWAILNWVNLHSVIFLIG